MAAAKSKSKADDEQADAPLAEAEAEAKAEGGDTVIAAETPPAKPGDADYDWTQHYPAGARLYVHTYPDGQTVALRTFDAIKSRQWIRSIRALENEIDIEDAAIERGGCPEAIAVIDGRPAPIDGPDDFRDLWNAWTRDATDRGDGKALDSGE